jgi:hypothetical protein
VRFTRFDTATGQDEQLCPRSFATQKHAAVAYDEKPRLVVSGSH